MARLPLHPAIAFRQAGATGQHQLRLHRPRQVGGKVKRNPAQSASDQVDTVAPQALGHAIWYSFEAPWAELLNQALPVAVSHSQVGWTRRQLGDQLLQKHTFLVALSRWQY